MSHATAANRFALVADIGGTNTRVALAKGETLQTDSIRRYRNTDFAGIETVLRRYIDDAGGVDCYGASVAIAGPVRDGKGTLTNLDWTIDEATLARATQAESVAVLNDLQAQGHALGRIAEENLVAVTPAAPAPSEGAKLVIGVGTGFNVAPVHDLGTSRSVPPSEAGHANLPVRTEAQLRLCQFIETAHGFPAVEDVLSGRGLERVFSWLAHEQGAPQEKKAAEIMAACADGDSHARDAVQIFVQMLGTVAGNQALIHLPFGGVFLVGGVSRAMAPYLGEFGFADAFRDKGRFAGFMQNFPVFIVEDDYAALTGLAANLARIA